MHPPPSPEAPASDASDPGCTVGPIPRSGALPRGDALLAPSPADREALLEALRTTRSLTLELCEPLAPETYRIQSMPDVSPPWWNLGHTSWFFARNILHPFGRYPERFEAFEFPLNSYYEGLGPRLARHRRGFVTRPGTEEILAYRREVDERLEALIEEVPEEDLPRVAFLTTVGIHHEQQHQELLVTEVQHILWGDPPALRQAYAPGAVTRAGDGAGDGAGPARFVPILGAGTGEGTLALIGHDGADSERDGWRLEDWAWDNEGPTHRVWLEPYALMDRLVTHREYLAFLEDGGYDDPLLWMSAGWAAVQAEGWKAPLYWERDGGGNGTGRGPWHQWTLGGLVELDPEEPVSHLSFYEADAFARWAAAQGGPYEGARLPTEAEWEHAAREAGWTGAVGPEGGGEPGANWLDRRRFHPARLGSPASGKGLAAPGGTLYQLGGDLWEWTSSHYEPYPGYKTFDGDLMEYNGKWMDNQRVLRGGSCATPASHMRVSYRNFWPAATRFQMTGVRLARDLR